MSREVELMSKPKQDLAKMVVDLESSSSKEDDKPLPSAYEWLQKVMCNESNGFETRFKAAELLLAKENVSM